MGVDVLIWVGYRGEKILGFAVLKSGFGDLGIVFRSWSGRMDEWIDGQYRREFYEFSRRFG